MADPSKGLHPNNKRINSIIDTAMRLADNGVPVFPVGAQKTPVWAKGESPNGKDGFHMATMDADDVDELFRHKSTTGIGMPTGAISGVTVIDVDCGKFKRNRDDALAWLEEHRDKLIGTSVVRTASGGYHYYCKYNESFTNTSNVWAKGVDCRNDGGYVVIPPFMGYQFVRQIDPDDWVDPPPAPERSTRFKVPTNDGQTPPQLIEMRDLIRDRVTWHEPVRDIVAHLVGSGWSDAEILTYTHQWTWPGYDPAETHHQLCVMIAGARNKWARSEEPQTTGAEQLRKLTEIWRRATPDTRKKFRKLIQEEDG